MPCIPQRKGGTELHTAELCRTDMEQEQAQNLISIIIPCYNSEKTIEKLTWLIQQEIKKIDHLTLELILVDDCSTDQTLAAIRKICTTSENVTGISLSKNFGQQNAIMAGLRYARGDLIMGMDDDMQTHPSQIVKFVNKINEGYDLVYGKYAEKKHSFFRNLASRLNDFSVRKLIGKPKGLTACSFWICKKFIRDEIIQYRNYHVHLQGLFLRTTSNIANVSIEHYAREFGASNYTLQKLLRLWSGCLNFSILPLQITGLTGAAVSFLGFCGIIVRIVRKIMHSGMAAVPLSPDWVTVFCSGLILLSLGLIGEYIGRILLCINGTPQYVIREIINGADKNG